jgi:hypothetical protein
VGQTALSSGPSRVSRRPELRRGDSGCRLPSSTDGYRVRQTGGSEPRLSMGQHPAGKPHEQRGGNLPCIREKHVPRYLAQFQYRFNRRYRLGDMRPLWHGWRCAPRQGRTVSSRWLRFVGNQEGSYRHRPDQHCPKCGMPCGSAVSCPVQACPLGGVEGGTPVAGSIRDAPLPVMNPYSPHP